VRNPPDLSTLLNTPRLLLDQNALLLTRTSQLGFSPGIETYAQWGLFALALLGAYGAIRSRRYSALALCVLMIVIPSLLLAVARTTNPVFQRYAIFVMPFYFLLIANGASRFWVLDFGFWIGRKKWQTQNSKLKTQNLVPVLLSTVVALIFVAGVFVYLSAEGHRAFSFDYPDYRGAAQYLSSVARPQDLIVIADEPALGAEVMNFYWKGNPPAPAYDARDPRLSSQSPTGSIFWVVSFYQNNPEFVRDLPATDAAWTDPKYLQRLVIMRDDRHNIMPGMEQLTRQASEKVPQFQPVRTLQGVIHQARGEISEAARLYKEAGSYFQLGDEFLASALGFAQRNEHPKAWSEAITSKFMQPGNPDLHDLLSRELLISGFPTEARTEEEIAKALR